MPYDRRAFNDLADRLPAAKDPAAVRRRIEAMERVLERAFTIPGLGRKVGLDAIVGLVPVVGDIAGAAMGSYLIWEARNLGMSKFQLMRMGANVGMDTALGFVPLVGDAFDLFFRSNSRNLRIVKRWLDKHHPAAGVTIDIEPLGPSGRSRTGEEDPRLSP